MYGVFLQVDLQGVDDHVEHCTIIGVDLLASCRLSSNCPIDGCHQVELTPHPATEYFVNSTVQAKNNRRSKFLSTLNLHQGQGFIKRVSLTMRATSSSSLFRLYLKYRTNTILPALGLQTGRPSAVRISNCTAPLCRSNILGGGVREVLLDRAGRIRC